MLHPSSPPPSWALGGRARERAAATTRARSPRYCTSCVYRALRIYYGARATATRVLRRRCRYPPHARRSVRLTCLYWYGSLLECRRAVVPSLRCRCVERHRGGAHLQGHEPCLPGALPSVAHCMCRCDCLSACPSFHTVTRSLHVCRAAQAAGSLGRKLKDGTTPRLSE